MVPVFSLSPELTRAPIPEKMRNPAKTTVYITAFRTRIPFSQKVERGILPLNEK